MKIGIQGGKGSFNEEALHTYTTNNNITDFETVYLYTTEAVLKAVESGEVDQGQFALCNSVGGVVVESMAVLGSYRYQVITNYHIEIKHFMMVRPGVNYEEIDTLMSHPQVYRQCHHTLKERFGELKQTIGEGELIDHAKVASELSQENLSKNIAVIGSQVLAKVFNLDIVAENLQDHSDNETTFLLVEKL